MGDPKKQRRKYDRPSHLWKTDRIQQENELTAKYGLSKKREIWRAKSEISRFRANARSLLGLATEGAQTRKKQLLDSVNRIGIKSNTLEDILTLGVEDILERRLQTVVYRKGLSNSTKQARQFITHKHVRVAGRVVDAPGYIISDKEEIDLEVFGIPETVVKASADEKGTPDKKEAEQAKKRVLPDRKGDASERKGGSFKRKAASSDKKDVKEIKGKKI